jgi:hypothetical protein
MSIPASVLKDTGLQLAKDTPSMPSLAVDIFGPSGSGKSHFAMTAPGPIVYSLFGAKNEIDGTVQHFENEKEIYVGRYTDAQEHPNKDDKSAMKKFFEAQNDRFEKATMAALRAGARTAVYDKGTDLWEAVRFEVYGAAATTGDYYRAIANNEWARLVRMVVEAGKNLVLIHEDDAEWGDTGERDDKGKPKRQPTGRRVRKGNEKTGFLIDVTLRAFRDKAKFYYEIVEAKKMPHLNGEVHEGLDFATLAMMVKPKVDPAVWF